MRSLRFRELANRKTGYACDERSVHRVSMPHFLREINQLRKTSACQTEGLIPSRPITSPQSIRFPHLVQTPGFCVWKTRRLVGFTNSHCYQKGDPVGKSIPVAGCVVDLLVDDLTVVSVGQRRHVAEKFALINKVLKSLPELDYWFTSRSPGRLR